MKEFTYVITDPEGIHARPAGELVKAAKAFECGIKLTKDGKTVTLTFDGADEDAAYEAVSKFMQENL